MSKKSTQKLLVSQSYDLNSMKRGYSTLREQRLFLMYLAKINPLDPNTRIVRLPFSVFAELCDIGNQKHINEYRVIVKKILHKSVFITTPRGGCKGFNLFEKCEIDQNPETLEWYFEIKATETAMPFFFEIKPYFTFELQYAIKLKSANQIRLYSLLKQHEKQRSWEFTLLELRELLDIQTNEYSDFKYFNRSVLEPSQRAINEQTDITVTYELRRTARKVSHILFKISPKTPAQLKKLSPLLLDSPSIENTENNLSTNGFYMYREERIQNKQGDSKKSIIKIDAKANKQRITEKDIENAKQNPMWNYALLKAERKQEVDNIVPYAAGTVKNWIKDGYSSVDDLLKNHIIKPRDLKDVAFVGKALYNAPSFKIRNDYEDDD